MVATLLWVDADCTAIGISHANREASAMARTFRSMLPLAAAVATVSFLSVSLLSIASPASAASVDETVATNAMAAAPDIKHRTSPRVRLAASRDQRRYVQPVPDCAGGWCRRPFVLMVGIAY
jgi:hypothetical protein